MPPLTSQSRYSLVGIGRCTKGLSQPCEPTQSVVIGRHSDCTIVVTRTPEAAEAVGFLSRHHAVIEEDPVLGWCVHDAGSTNGTAVLKGGVPPAVRLAPATKHALQPDDVIELAGSDEFQFVYLDSGQRADSSPADGRTQRIFTASRASVQWLVEGRAADLWEMDRGDLRVGADGGASWNAPAGAAPLLVFSLARGVVSVRCLADGARRNLEPLRVGQTVELRDRDLLTFTGNARASALFLDPKAVSVRALSDLLMDADRITVGTAADNTCRLMDPSLSRHHAVVWREETQLFVRDLDSSNGTFVDGHRVFDATAVLRDASLMLGRLPFVADSSCWPGSPGQPAHAPSLDVRVVGVSVEIAGKLRLRNVSIGVGQGEMVGLLGPSASGKSTLLKVLAGHYKLAGGDVYVNGRALSGGDARQGWFRSLMGFRDDAGYEVGFVQQIDLVQPELTVREILEFAGRHMGLPAAEAAQRAQRAGELCNLGPLMDRIAQLGNGQLNLSGGQLKRVCVGIEVLRQPRILVLDEPTTGQDPKNTDDLMNLFRSLAQEGVTLLMSTHDLRNLALFDKVAALCLGHLVYFGPADGFAPHFGAATAEDVYASLPDREERIGEAEALAARFKTTPLYRQYCEVD